MQILFIVGDAVPDLTGAGSDWKQFLIMAGAFVLVLTGFLVWLAIFRKKRRRHKHHHHHDRHRHGHRPLNPTLAQTGGLPPLRSDNKPPDWPESKP